MLTRIKEASMLKAWIAFQNMINEDDGATLVEYALLLVLIAVVAMGIIATLGGNVSETFNEVNTELEGVVGSTTTAAP